MAGCRLLISKFPLFLPHEGGFLDNQWNLVRFGFACSSTNPSFSWMVFITNWKVLVAYLPFIWLDILKNIFEAQSKNVHYTKSSPEKGSVEVQPTSFDNNEKGRDKSFLNAPRIIILWELSQRRPKCVFGLLGDLRWPPDGQISVLSSTGEIWHKFTESRVGEGFVPKGDSS